MYAMVGAYFAAASRIDSLACVVHCVCLVRACHVWLNAPLSSTGAWDSDGAVGNAAVEPLSRPCLHVRQLSLNTLFLCRQVGSGSNAQDCWRQMCKWLLPEGGKLLYAPWGWDCSVCGTISKPTVTLCDSQFYIHHSHRYRRGLHLDVAAFVCCVYVILWLPEAQGSYAGAATLQPLVIHGLFTYVNVALCGPFLLLVLL
jgi:hypothetical protein